MCCKSIKRLQSKNGLSIANSEIDRSMPFWHMLGNYSCGLLEIDHFDRLMQQQQQHQNQEHHNQEHQNQEHQNQEHQNQEHQFKKGASSEDCPRCAVSQMCPKSYIGHKQTNVRFSAANLLANLVI